MRKHDKHKSASEMRVAKNRRLDYLENQKMTKEQKDAWERKPYAKREG